MYVKVRKRTLIVLSVLAALLVMGLCAGVLATDLLRKQEKADAQAVLASGWRQSVSELSLSLSELEIDLQKGLYSSGDYQTVSWAARVFAEAGAARAALEALPIYELRLQGTETFLNQVGEFTLEMARKQLRGEALSEKEEASLQRLALRSQELADEVLAMAEKIADENPGYEEMQQLLLPSAEGEEKTEFESLEEIFSKDEPLTYDGEHSAWRENRASYWLKSLSDADEASLKQRAANLLSADPKELKEGGTYESPFAFREYRKGDQVVALTVRGGHLYGMSRLREVSQRVLSVEESLSAGAKHLAQLGYPNLEAVRWNTSENTVTAVYVLRQDGFLIYSDRITVTIAMDTGEILTLNAVEYLLAHDPDRELAYSRSQKECAAVLRDDLTVLEGILVSVPGGDGKERLCWQFLVRDDTETKVLVFVNAETLVEEEILILLEGDEFRNAV